MGTAQTSFKCEVIPQSQMKEQNFVGYSDCTINFLQPINKSGSQRFGNMMEIGAYGWCSQLCIIKVSIHAMQAVSESDGTGGIPWRGAA